MGALGVPTSVHAMREPLARLDQPDAATGRSPLLNLLKAAVPGMGRLDEEAEVIPPQADSSEQVNSHRDIFHPFFESQDTVGGVLNPVYAPRTFKVRLCLSACRALFHALKDPEEEDDVDAEGHSPGSDIMSGTPRVSEALPPIRRAGEGDDTSSSRPSDEEESMPEDAAFGVRNGADQPFVMQRSGNSSDEDFLDFEDKAASQRESTSRSTSATEASEMMLMFAISGLSVTTNLPKGNLGRTDATLRLEGLELCTLSSADVEAAGINQWAFLEQVVRHPLGERSNLSTPSEDNSNNGSERRSPQSHLLPPPEPSAFAGAISSTEVPPRKEDNSERIKGLAELSAASLPSSATQDEDEDEDGRGTSKASSFDEKVAARVSGLGLSDHRVLFVITGFHAKFEVDPFAGLHSYHPEHLIDRSLSISLDALHIAADALCLSDLSKLYSTFVFLGIMGRAHKSSILAALLDRDETLRSFTVPIQQQPFMGRIDDLEFSPRSLPQRTSESPP